MGAPRLSGSVHHTRSTLSPTASTRNCPGATGVSPKESNVEMRVSFNDLEMFKQRKPNQVIPWVS